MQHEQGLRRRCLADWGPDTLAFSCNLCGFACWVGAARVRSLLPKTLHTQVDEPPPQEEVRENATNRMEAWVLQLAYDGTDFAGWQKQSEDVRTVQGEVDKALSLVFRASVRTCGASRTDRGVHAQGQVCHFEAPAVWANTCSRLDPETALRRLRLTLPSSILARKLNLVGVGFHARLSAIQKRYSYRLSTTSSVMPFEARQCWLCGELDLDAMQSAISSLSGVEMDYSAFTTGENEPDYHGPVVKTVLLSMQVDSAEGIFVYAVADRFLYKMVRRIVGGLVEVGKGRIAPASLARADRRLIPTAPPEGLSLDEVVYPQEIQALRET
mmetsp:Transcript_53683/g.125118  ORF Transcript_53683/g.125118 Transcript_53683/m.125118 type:complete len:327 (-) Transcript_53683:208-1188(-)